MKFSDYLLKGAQGRVEADMRSAKPTERPYVFATSLANELGSKMAAEIASLRAEIAQLQRNPADQYKGAFRRDLEYRRGDTATHKGALWLALADNNDTPGASSAWRLVAKGDRPQ